MSTASRCLCGFLGLLFLQSPSARGDEPAARPNIVVVLVDDLRFDDIGCMGQPFVKTPAIDRIAREGALFQNAFATTPLCSPSRASILTGQYVHQHGILDNTDRSARSHQLVTFPLLLQRAGYETAYVGKWHMGVDDKPRPGFDHWFSFQGQGHYLDPDVNQDGKRQKAKGYATDILNQRAVAFVQRPHGKPFCLYLAHKAVHPNLHQNADGSLTDQRASNFVPAERHKDLYADARIERRPSAGRKPEGKPALLRQIGDLPPLGPRTGTSDDDIRNRLRMNQAVEEGVGQLLAALEQSRQLDRTVFVFTSDHGYFYGEHGLSVERRLAYEEAIRIPLLIRYPPRIKPGSTVAAMVLNLDLAPTLLDLAGVAVPRDVQGKSLVPLLKGEVPKLRDDFLIEYFTDTVFPRVHKMGYQAVRTGRWKYLHYTELEGMDELYDLQADPNELRNRIADPSAAAELATLKKRLAQLLEETK